MNAHGRIRVSGWYYDASSDRRSPRDASRQPIAKGAWEYLQCHRRALLSGARRRAAHGRSRPIEGSQLRVFAGLLLSISLPMLVGCDTLKQAYGIKAREVHDKMNYTGADAACIESANSRFLNNPYDDHADTGIATIDGQDVGGGPNICLRPGHHEIEVNVFKGYSGATANLQAEFVAQGKYRVHATLVNATASCALYAVAEDGTEKFLAGADAHADSATPPVYVPPMRR